MAASVNVQPIFTLFGALETGVVATTANTSKDGSSGTIYTIFDPVLSVTSISQSGGVATITFAKARGLPDGIDILVMGASPAAYNGKKSITITGPTTATFSIDSLTSSPATGTITAAIMHGTRVSKVIFQPVGTNATASVGRVFINNGGLTTSAANNTYFKDVTLPVSTVIETASMAQVEMDVDLVLAPFHRLFVTVGTTGAAGWSVTAVGGAY